MVHAADDNLDAGLGLERIRKRQHLDEVLVRNGKRKAGVCTVVRGHGDHIDVDIELRDALEYLSHKACGGGVTSVILLTVLISVVPMICSILS